MKVYCITENIESEIGLKLAGCDGTTLEKADEIDKKIDEVLENKEIGVLVISQDVYNKVKEKIEYIKHNRKLPLITII